MSVQIQISQLATGQLATFIQSLIFSDDSVVVSSQALNSGDQSTLIPFAPPLSGVPAIVCSVSSPMTGFPGILAAPQNVTVTGFTASYSNSIPSSGYILNYLY